VSNIWNRLARPEFGLADRISDAMGTLEWREPGSIADVRNSKELIVACDFAGAHKAAKFEAFAFLLGAVGGSARWMKERAVVRDRLLPDGRRMAYKALNDKIRRKALSPFLAASNAFPGNLFIVMIRRNIQTLFDDPGSRTLFPELIVAEYGWKRKSFHRLLLIASLGALFVSGLSSPEQDILWVTDQDEIAPNPEKHDVAGHVFDHCISRYAPANHGMLTFVTTEVKFDNNRVEDLVAVVDLAAGSLVDAFAEDGLVSSGSIWVPLSSRLSHKARTLLDWFADDSQNLRRFVIVLDHSGRGIEVHASKPIQSDGRQLFLLR
jgi:hypothetical protein